MSWAQDVGRSARQHLRNRAGADPGRQEATTAADPDSYRDRIVLNDGSIILYDPRTDRWTVSSTEEVTASDERRLTSP